MIGARLVLQFASVRLVHACLIGGTTLHTLTLLSSSLVEEEHQTWYFLVVTVFLLIGCEQLVAIAGGNARDANRFSSCKPVASSGVDGTGRCAVNCADEWRDVRKDRMSSGQRRGQLLAVGVLLACCRVARTWNQTGNKWAHLPDASDWLVRCVLIGSSGGCSDWLVSGQVGSEQSTTMKRNNIRFIFCYDSVDM